MRIKNKFTNNRSMAKVLCLLFTIIIAMTSMKDLSVFVYASNSEALPSVESTYFDRNDWLLSNAYYDETNDYFVLTDDYSIWQTGSIWFNHPYDNDFTLEMDYYTGSANRSLGGADGIVVAFYANYSYTMSGGEEIGFNGSGGYGIELDTYQNTNRGDPSRNHIGLIKEDVGNHLITAELSESEDEQWHHLKIVVIDGVCSAYVDNTFKFEYAVEENGFGWIGITSATGDGENLHAVKDIIISGNNSTSVDGNFLDVKLSHNKISNNCTSDVVNGMYEYEITAEIKNSAKAMAKNVTATLDVEHAFQITDSTPAVVEVGDIASGQSKYVRWTVRADWPDENFAATYAVTANIDNSASLRQENYIYLQIEHPIENDQKTEGIVVYSDYTNLSIRKGSTITLSAGILADGELTNDVSRITFQIEDTSILNLSTTDINDNCRYVKLKGLAEGTTTVVFNDSTTGYTAKIPVTVYDDNYLSYTLNSVPTQNIEKYPTNVYNVNGLYIDSYKYTVNDDQSATVSFDVYNTNYTYGVVEVFNENGNMKDAVLIEKMTSSNTSIKEAVWDNVGYLVRDIIDGDLLSYRQESGYSKKTSVSVKIPRNGYIKICTDPENSLIVGLVNSVDGLMSMASLAGDVKDFDVNSKEFSKKLTTKLLTDQVYVEIIKDGSDASKDLWKNVGKETFITSESMGNFTDTITKNIDELKLGSIIADTAADFGWDVGENVFTYFAGPAGTALNVIFTIGKVENLIIQQNDLIQSAGVGSIYIQNQGGGLRSCQQIKVKSEDEFSSDTALNVFTVTLNSTLLDVIKELNPDVYEAMSNGITYTYNISLLKNGDETQPDGKVTVYIPIPEDLKVLAYASEFTGEITGKVKIYRVEEDGSLTEMDVEIEDGCFVFTTDHFSLYTIVGCDLDEDTIENQDGNGISMIVIIGIAAVVIVGVGTIIIFKRKKK